MLAELMGRDDGLCRGLGGSMHLVDVEHGFMGATGVVGGNIPLALGSALAARLRGDDAVAVVFFGDGAVQAGHFNESVNLAALWRLPVILVCENNGFAEFTPRSAHTVVERVSDVVAPYGLERETVDGNDVGAVWDAFGALPRGGARRRRPVPARVPDPPPARPLRRRPGQVPRGARRRGVAGAGPDRCASSATASRRAGSTDGRRCRRRGRRARGGRGGRARSRARSPFPPAELTGELVYARCLRPTTTSRRSTSRSPTAMRADERVFVMGEDVAEGGPYTATAGLAEEFGAERVLNTPISEAAICGVAIGAAQSGLRPVLEIMFIDFITLALDQLVNGAAKAHFMSGGQLHVPLVLRTQGGAGQRGGGQHSQSLESWLTHVPGLKVVMPSRPADAAGLLASAIADPEPGRLRREQGAVLPQGRGAREPPRRCRSATRATLRAGRDVTIVAPSRLVARGAGGRRSRSPPRRASRPR